MLETNPPKKQRIFNKHGRNLRWPRIWIVVLGIILIFLCLSIAGMEVGNILFDLRRSTAFGGFIVFIPLLICAICILLTACIPRLLLLRIVTILCFIMIILCLALIGYDILVIIDPTRCFLLSCNDASVYYSVNSTYNSSVTGWPLNISWPTYFNTNMTYKRIFQSIQIFCAALFILFSSLFILTYFIYRHINLHEQAVDNHNDRKPAKHEITTAPAKHLNNKVSSQPSHGTATMFSIAGQFDAGKKHNYSQESTGRNTVKPQIISQKSVAGRRTSSISPNRICTRCKKEPRMVLSTDYEQKNFYAHMCSNCNNELLDRRRKSFHNQ